MKVSVDEAAVTVVKAVDVLVVMKVAGAPLPAVTVVVGDEPPLICQVD